MPLKMFLIAVATMCHVTNACSPTDDPSDASMDTVETHLERLCNSELVFTGRITNTVTTEDADFIYVTTTFRALAYWRDTTGSHALNVDVRVDYPKAFMCCRAEPFDLSGDAILVFASSFGGDTFVFPCVGHPPNNTVPPQFFDAVLNDNPCGDGGFIGGPVEQPDGTRPPTIPTEASTAATSMVLPTLVIFPFLTEVPCPKDGVDDVIVDAQVNLTGVDPSSVSNVVDFNFSNETCGVDLTACPGTSTDLCYCVQQSESVYTIRLDMTADRRYSDVEVKVTITDSNFTSVLSTSNSTNYPEILGEITQSLRTDNRVFYLNAAFRLLDMSEEEGTANLWYDVSGLNSPYQIMIQPFPDGPTFLSNDGPLSVIAVDLNYTGVTLSYEELDGPCARNYSETYSFSAARDLKACHVALTPFVLGLGVLKCLLGWSP